MDSHGTSQKLQIIAVREDFVQDAASHTDVSAVRADFLVGTVDARHGDHFLYRAAVALIAGFGCQGTRQQISFPSNEFQRMPAVIVPCSSLVVKCAKYEVPRTRLDDTRDVADIALLTEERGTRHLREAVAGRSARASTATPASGGTDMLPIIAMTPDEMNKLVAAAMSAVAAATASMTARPSVGTVVSGLEASHWEALGRLQGRREGWSRESSVEAVERLV
eukprot:gene23716-28743_t